jgi:hypothetical protein
MLLRSSQQRLEVHSGVYTNVKKMVMQMNSEKNAMFILSIEINILHIAAEHFSKVLK